MGLDPVAEFTPPTESRHGAKGASLPLELLARKADNFLNTTFSNVPSVQELEENGYWKFPQRTPGHAGYLMATGFACSMGGATFC